MTVEGRPRSRSFSSTPTFSSDLARLKSSSSSTVHSYKEAIAIASTFDVLGNNSALTPKLKLTSEDDWIQFFKKSGAVDTTSSGEGEGEGGSTVVVVHMERFLRYCFDIAYKMPPSPNNKILRGTLKEAQGAGGGVAVVPSLSI